MLKGIGFILIVIFGLLINPILYLIGLFIPEDKTSYYHRVRKFIFLSNNCCSGYYEDSFTSEGDFKDFDKEYFKKFSPHGNVNPYSTKPKVKFLFYEYGSETKLGGSVSNCKTCGQLWELSEPDLYWRGYFKPIDIEPVELKKYLN